MKYVHHLLGLLLLSLLTACANIDPSEIGLIIERAGSNRGVHDIPTVSGYTSYNPLTEDVIQFPGTVQTRVWTASPHEGQTIDESITFQSSEGVPVNADVALSYHVDAAHAGRLYTRFRLTDLSVLTDGYVRNLVRDAMVERAAAVAVHELYGAGKSRVLNEALTAVRERLGHDGFVIDQLTYQGQMRFPQTIVDSINRTAQAQQDALQAQNQVAIREAEARQRVAAAEGAARVQHTEAAAAADALLTRAAADVRYREMLSTAEAAANQRLAASLTPQLIELRRIERWNGVMPQFQTGGTPLIQFPAAR
jgi:regulator of protease activity HflC (stomatin/prohibitin superfamily)